MRLLILVRASFRSSGSRPKVGVKAPAGSRLRRQYTGRGTLATGTPAAAPDGVTGNGVRVCVHPLRMLWQARGRYCKSQRCSAVEGLGGFGQCVKRGVEAVLAAPVGV